MAGGDGGPSRATGGKFFLSLPQNRNQSYPPQQSPNIDPVVAAMGPTIHTRQQWSLSYGHDLSSRRLPTSSWSRHSPPYPPNFFLQGFSQNPGNSSQQGSSEDHVRRFGFHQNHNPELMFVPKKPELGLGNGSSTGLGMNRKLESRANSTNSHRMGNYDNHEQVWKGNGGWGRQEHGLAHWSSQEGNYDNRDQVRRGNGGWGRQQHGLAHRSSQEGNYDNREQHRRGNGGWGRQEHDLAHWPSQEMLHQSPGFSSNSQGGRRWNGGNRRRKIENNVGVKNGGFGESSNRAVASIHKSGLTDQFHRPGSNLHSVKAWRTEESLRKLHDENEEITNEHGYYKQDKMRRDVDGSNGNNNKKKGQNSRDKKSGRTDQFDRPGLSTGSNLHQIKASGIEESLLNLHAEIEEIANEHGYYKQVEMRRDVDGSNGNNVEAHSSKESPLTAKVGSIKQKNKKKDRNFRDKKSGLTDQFDRPGLSTGSNLHQIKASGIEESLLNLHAEIEEIANEHGYYTQVEMRRDVDGSNGNNVEAHSSKESSLTAKVGSIKQKNKKKDRNFRDKNSGLTDQFDRPGLSTGSNLHQIKASGIEESLLNVDAEIEEIANEHGYYKQVEMRRDVDGSNGNNVEAHSSKESPLTAKVGSIKQKNKKKGRNFRDKDEMRRDVDGSNGNNDKKKGRNSRGKQYIRADIRGKWLLSQKMGNMKGQKICRSDIDILNAPFLAIYESLIPSEEEKAKQKQLLTLLEKLVSKEWPEAQLYLYGSCANSFAISKSDIDVCLTIDDAEINKSEFLLRLAEILQSDNFHNVQALTRTRVPIVKLMDPVTGISCDLSINNVLAVLNTKLLRDYAQIDVRLQQLSFIVKHWAKSRGVNQTYQGTLSSYAYVLMCIHFLQQRKPAVLPCLQGMETTCSVTVDDVECAYFDRVEKLRGFGSHNKETIAQLVWEFFNYWAYCHDYADTAISVRTGTIISKQSKDWTTWVGNDRHFICIEDPFETSHDLGRPVNLLSIKVLMEEFERAANIMQDDPNPCVKLFEPCVREGRVCEGRLLNV